MKRNLVFLLIICCVFMTGIVFATDGGLDEMNKSPDTPKLEDLKAEIYLKPEDSHPNGVNMEVGTASFWFEVGARVSGDFGETVSYQWYESKTGNMDDLLLLSGETKSIFIPEQVIGTTYYCAGVITSLGSESIVEYTKLLEATFTPKMIDKIWITEVKEPIIGERPNEMASQYTDYELNNYYGYEITSVKWTPSDDVFKENVKYTVDVEIEFWDNVEFTEKVDVKINNMEATLKKNADGETAVVSYTFEKPSKNTSSGDYVQSGDEEIEYGNSEYATDEKLDLSVIILSTICAIIVVFALVLIFKNR